MAEASGVDVVAAILSLSRDWGEDVASLWPVLAWRRRFVAWLGVLMSFESECESEYHTESHLNLNLNLKLYY